MIMLTLNEETFREAAARSEYVEDEPPFTAAGVESPGGDGTPDVVAALNDVVGDITSGVVLAAVGSDRLNATAHVVIEKSFGAGGALEGYIYAAAVRWDGGRLWFEAFEEEIGFWEVTPEPGRFTEPITRTDQLVAFMERIIGYLNSVIAGEYRNWSQLIAPLSAASHILIPIVEVDKRTGYYHGLAQLPENISSYDVALGLISDVYREVVTEQPDDEWVWDQVWAALASRGVTNLAAPGVDAWWENERRFQ